MGRSGELDFSVLSPAGSPDPSLAIAASRAGALGILNLEFAADHDDVAACLDRLTRHGRGRLGALLDPGSERLLEAVLSPRYAAVGTVALSTTTERLDDVVGRIHRAGRRAFVVATTAAGALAAEAAGADALIAKGHEAGGWVGDETAFVLLQRLVAAVRAPIWVLGGIGLHTAAACQVAGAAGAVLESQVLLAKESPLADSVRARIRSMDGSETACFGASFGAACRAYARPDLPAVAELQRLEAAAMTDGGPTAATQQTWRAAVRERVGWERPERQVLAIGQDAAFAAALADRFGTAGGILAAFRQAVRDHCDTARAGGALGEGAPLARSHGTRYPIVQGPMTRVSDRAEFAAAVAGAGALPFLALSLMRAPDVRALLEETQRQLGDRPWGVGILGFVPPELRAEQLEVTRAYRPAFALIAGGRPAQAKELEQEGIATYLHVPSPGLLRMFLQDGARRFVFEGRECGGHVGPRSSFVLWDTMVDVLLQHLPAGASGEDYHVLFAGGIHDGLSAAMVAAIAAPLVAGGVRIGVLLGTAYLFTEEAVATGAITPGFQQAALACERTALLETGPGHATRCAPSPFVDFFEQEKRRLLKGGTSREDARNHLEMLNIGRLRIASKGVDRNPRYGQDPAEPRLVPLDDEAQRSQGMYMIGQVAALRDRTCTLEELHRDVSEGSVRRLADAALPAPPPVAHTPAPAAIAIVGMGCIMPGAPDLRTFWANILNKVDAITEVPKSRWDWRHYYDPDRSARDKVYSRWGGFIDEVPFDPLTYGMPPNTLPSIEPFQLLALAVVRAALADAGYLDRPFDRERASVILGAGGGGADLASGYVVRSMLPELFGESAAELTDRLGGALPEWTEDSFAGILMNVAAGRIANRFDLGGVNYTVDAACASSLAAVYLAVRDLEARTSDVAIVGGVDAIQNPFSFLCFSKTQALSPTGRCRTFDAQGDGIAISEGFAALVLKRLDDAERDGDRIYAVIRGVGGSSDGRDRSLTAPRPEGQVRALRRAYAQAGFSPATVGLIEAHGTGTVAGDQAEIRALTTFFAESGAGRQECAVGSVKSMIGHTKAAAGVAGLTKVALSLHHRVLPPTLGVTQPNPKAKFPESPFYVNTEARPWVQSEGAGPRRAGASSFGFGGTNFHVVAEEYTGAYLPSEGTTLDPWLAELFLWRGSSRAEILGAIVPLLQKLEQGARPALADLAATVIARAGDGGDGRQTLALVATSLDDLVEKLRAARALLGGSAEREHAPQGLHYAERPLAADGKVAVLFPGQGSQYVNMARDLAVVFPEVRESLDRSDAAIAGRLPKPLSRYVFPQPSFGDEEERAQQAALTETSVAQPALGAVEVAMERLLRSLGAEPDMVAGHSYAELVALHAAGCFDEDVLLHLSEARGRYIREGTTDESGTMAAVEATPDQLHPILDGLDVVEANKNAPRQTVISGTRAGVEAAIARCAERGLRARLLPVSCAFHSPLVAPARDRLAAELRQAPMRSPRLPVYSNTTAAAYPSDPSEIVGILSAHLTSPVDFVGEISAMHADGARVFVEVGPRNVLCGLVERILGERPHVCVPVDQPGRHGLVQLLHALASLASEGVPVRAERLFRGRSARRLNLDELEQETGQPRYTPTTWLVDGGRARPANPRPGASAPPTKPLKVAVVDTPAAPQQTVVATTPARPEPQPAAAVGTTPNGSAASSARDQPSPRQLERTVTIHTNGVSHAEADVPSRDGRPAAPLSPEPDRPAAGVALVRPDVAIPAAPFGERAEVMAQFQHVMQRFLQTQKAVMLAYLGVAEAAASVADPERRAGLLYGAVGAAPLAEPRPQPTRAAYAPPAPAAPAEEAREAVRPMPASPPAGPAPAAGYAEAVPRDVDGQAPAPPREPAPRPEAEVPAMPPAPAASDGPAQPMAAAQPAAAPPSRQQLTERLLAIVSERTGYPTEMLALDADLEADLGVDSIKRVEIAGTIIQTLALPPGSAPDTERLSASRTLAQVIDLLEAMVAPQAAASAVAEEASPRPFDSGPSSASGVGRFTLRTALLPTPGPAASLCREGAVVIVDDEAGTGARLADALEARGYRAVRIVQASATPSEDGRVLAADVGRPDEVARLASWLRDRHGFAAGLVHLAALRPGAPERGFDQAAWRQRLAADLQSLFLLAQALQPDLERAATRGGAAVLAATQLGGDFAAGDSARPFFAGHGGIAGFVKTLALEWPAVRAKAVDVDAAPPDQLADWLLAELLAADGAVEVGYRDGRRSRLEPVPAPLDGTAAGPIGEGSVILLTGGARGITAETALDLARRYRPTLLLVGRTPLPSAPEAPDTAGITEAGALKRALIERQRAAGHAVTPARIEELYRQLVREREVRDNVARLGGAGARVHYYACDVRDAAAFGALVDELYRAFGRIDGAIHGAGVIEDKLIRDKRLDSFERVLQTKLEGALVLARKLRPETLRFLVFFSSVSGRFGNRGQGDYAAASEVLNKLAQQLDRAWPGRVVSINWGPWLTTGMVSPEVRRQFAERGVTLIPPEVGCRFLDEELRWGRKGDVEVLIGGSAALDAGSRPAGQRASSPGQPSPAEPERPRPSLPLLMTESTRARASGDTSEFLRTLRLGHDRYLGDHRLDGRPVFPFAGAIELMAEAAAASRPGLQVVEVRNVRVLRGIVVDRDELPLRIAVRPVEGVHGRGDPAAHALELAVTSTGDAPQPHYLSIVELRPDLPPHAGQPGELGEAGPFPMGVDEAYRAWLFHGPIFQHIASIEAAGPRGATTFLRPSSPGDCLHGASGTTWLIDPIVVDSAFQMQVLWARLHWDVTLLPARVGSYRRVAAALDPSARPIGSSDGSLIRHEMRVRPESRAPICHADHYFYAPDGRLLGVLTDVEGTGTKALNRLAGGEGR